MNKIKILIVFVTIVFFSLVIFLIPRIITIDEIHCISQFGPCKQNITENLSNIEQNSLLSSKNKIDEYFSENTLISEYSVQFKLPRKLLVNIIEKKPVFGVKAGPVSEIALIDKNGEVILVEKISSLPILITNDSLPEVGQILPPGTIFALEIVADMHSTYHVSEGLIENNSLVFILKNDLSVTFPLEGDVKVLMGSLSSILSQLNINGQDTKIMGADKVKLIDLRFKNPVIK